MIRIPTNNAMLHAITEFGVRGFTVNVYPGSELGQMFMMFGGAFNNPEAVQTQVDAALPVVVATDTDNYTVVIFEADKGYMPESGPHPSINHIVKRLNLAYRANERSLMLTGSWNTNASGLAEAFGLRAVINYDGEKPLSEFLKLEAAYYAKLRSAYDSEESTTSDLPFQIDLRPGYVAGMLQKMVDNPDTEFQLYRRMDRTAITASFNQLVEQHNARYEFGILVGDEGSILIEPSYSMADGKAFGRYYFKAKCHPVPCEMTGEYDSVIALTPLTMCALRDYGKSFTVLPTQSRTLSNENTTIQMVVGEAQDAVIIDDESITGTSSLKIGEAHFSDDRIAGEVNTPFMINDPEAIAFLKALGAETFNANEMFASIGN